MLRILHIDDDANLRKWLKQALVREGFTVDGTPDPQEGFHLIKQFNHDVILLDIGLPAISGLDLLRTLRSQGNAAAIFMISGQGGQEEKLTAFRDGADDYMVKPFFIAELVARIHTYFRRLQDFSKSNPSRDGALLQAGILKMDLLKRKVTVNEKLVTPTPKEYALLEFLVRRKGRVVSPESLAQAVWPAEKLVDPNVVEVHVGRLRDKLAQAGLPSVIQTVRGAGYMIEDTTTP
jgi:DNA-binding response OmpR family regulator